MRLKIKKVNVDKYVHFMNFMFGLTETEMSVLTEFIEVDIELKRKNEHLSAFSTDGKKIVANRLGKDNTSFLNTYIVKLKDKKALIKKNGEYYVHDILYPDAFPNHVEFVLQWG